jgi:hypothetical protein
MYLYANKETIVVAPKSLPNFLFVVDSSLVLIFQMKIRFEE